MKWFKHDTDMHTDLKIQNLIEKHGAEGYAIFNLCLEMVGKEGTKGKIDGRLRWKQLICKVVGWSDNGKLESIINSMAELGLICSKSLKYGNLHIPKFTKRADDYTMRKLRTNSEYSTDNVHLDKNRIDKIRIEYAKLRGLDINNFQSDDFARTAKAIKTLVIKSKFNDNLVIKSIAWAANQTWCDWTLETIIRRWPDFMKNYKPRKVPKPDLACPICGGNGKILEGAQKGGTCICVK